MVLYNEKLCYSQKKNRIDNYVNRHNKITSTMWALRADTFLALFQKVVQAQVHVRFWFGTVEKKLWTLHNKSNVSGTHSIYIGAVPRIFLIMQIGLQFSPFAVSVTVKMFKCVWQTVHV